MKKRAVSFRCLPIRAAAVTACKSPSASEESRSWKNSYYNRLALQKRVVAKKKALNVRAGMTFLLTILHACSVQAFIPYQQRAGYSVNRASIGLMFHVLE